MRTIRKRWAFKRTKKQNLRKYGFEFLSIFIAIIAALDNWNDNRKDQNSEINILTEISNGLKKDIVDVKMNKEGHLNGINAIKYFKRNLNEDAVDQDSLRQHYVNLTRDFISIQNTAGYETLKSKGLEVIKNDSLRLEIISLYEYDYNILYKLEEEYPELQFQNNYFKEVNSAFAPNFKFDANSEISGIVLPLNLSNNEKNNLKVYFGKMKNNRAFILQYYTDVEIKIRNTIKDIHQELSKK